MKGVMRASVSAGSSHRETRVTCTPMARVPSGGAARAGNGPTPIPKARPNIRTAAMRQHEGRIMTPPKEYSQCAASGLVFAGADAVRKLAQRVTGHIVAFKGGHGRKRACRGSRDWLWHG